MGWPLPYRLRVPVALVGVLGSTLAVLSVPILVPIGIVLAAIVVSPALDLVGWEILLVAPAFLLVVVVEELRYATTFGLDRAAAPPIDAAEQPALHELVARVAKLHGVPTLRVAIVETAVPEAMVVGVRQRRTTLVLSTGLLDALDRDELEAVVAHELAHVASRRPR